MKKVGIVLLSVVLGLVVLTGVIGSTIWSHRNQIVTLEESIDAQTISHKNSYDTMWKKFKEMTQVTELQAEQFKDVYTDLIQGRNQDTNLLFKVVQEDNPQLDKEVYSQLQRQISSDRATFENNQNKVIDYVREYNVYIAKNPITTMILGKQKKDSNDYIITSDNTEEAFKTGKTDSIKLK